MNTRYIPALVALVTLGIGLLFASAVNAQDAALHLDLQRTWGYSGFNNDIQGTFLLKASGPADLARVEFFIDTKKIGEASGAPFTLQFVTDDYSAGDHTLSARGVTSDDKEMKSQVFTVRFITAAEGTGAMLKIVVPILVIVFGAIGLAAIAPVVTGRRTQSPAPGTQRQYPIGGGICPKCGRPVVFHLFGLNIPGGKFERCPSCGKWSLIRYAPLDKLRAAEQAEVASGQVQVTSMSTEQKLKKDLDESKYQDV